MKIGVNLVGIYKGPRNRNFNITTESIFKNIINCWGEKPKIYITTYHSDEDDELIQFYKPEKYQFLSFEDSNQRSTYIKSLEQLKNEDLDFIISTRFDINFFKKLSDFNIDFNKTNFLFKESNQGQDFTSDVLFCFPMKHLTPFINNLNFIFKNFSAKRRRNPSFNQHMHNMYYFLYKDIGKENINFMVDGDFNSSSNLFFELKRN